MTGNLKYDPDSRIELILQTLCEGKMPALSAYEGGSLAEAASVCLMANAHRSPVVLTVRGDHESKASLVFLAVTDQMQRTHGDPEVATERGACAIAILLVCALSDYTVVHRSYQGTGIDYFLGDKDDFLFQHKARLEVSGIGAGSETDIRRRKQIKIEQTQRSDDLQIPAIVVIVEFSRPVAEVVQR
jgi:hypothetical protein